MFKIGAIEQTPPESKGPITRPRRKALGGLETIFLQTIPYTIYNILHNPIQTTHTLSIYIYLYIYCILYCTILHTHLCRASTSWSQMSATLGPGSGKTQASQPCKENYTESTVWKDSPRCSMVFACQEYEDMTQYTFTHTHIYIYMYILVYIYVYIYMRKYISRFAYSTPVQGIKGHGKTSGCCGMS